MANPSVKKTFVLLIGIIYGINTRAQIVQINPPLFGFYSKYMDCGGIAIRAPNVVNDKALTVAAQKINMMLANIPEARHNLAQWGAELHIIGKDQQTSDLPEFRDQKGVSYVDNLGVTTNIDARTRGMGGIYTSCGEENLLNLPGDRYAGGSDICIHEFAHNVMYYGLDDDLEKKIKDLYKIAIDKGLWKGAYASVDAGEYWAELSMWYFGAHGEYLKGAKLPVAGPDGLKAYDPDGYALLSAIYSGKLKTAITDVTIAQTTSPKVKPTTASSKAWLMFTNNTTKKLLLFWVDYTGKSRPYGAISPFSKLMQKTFMGDVWRVQDEKGKAIGYYTATSPYAMATLK
jgi:hypothetical protein